jgi:murein DD-endopeptidase MepM/ murein hydrolase activator NlpD
VKVPVDHSYESGSKMPYLENQKLHSRKRPERPSWLHFVLVISLGLNVYYLLIVSPAEMAPLGKVEVSQQAELSSPKQEVSQEPVMAMDEALIAKEEKAKAGTTRKATVQGNSLKVQQASFTTADHMGGEQAHALHVNIKNSLTYTFCKVITKEQGCNSLSAHVGRLLTWFFDINSKMRKGDSLTVIYQEVSGNERFKVLNLVYESAYFHKTFAASYYQEPGSSFGAYYDNAGREIAKRIIDRQTPIREYIEITSLPGEFRKNQRRGHSGTDFKANVGTPIFASFEGKVTRTNWNTRANGYCIEIDHPREGVKTLYLHLSKVKVKKGTYVKQGEMIAESGNTGRTFAPHLHFEIKHRKNKDRIYSPFNFKHFKSYNRTISAAHQDGFQKRLQYYNSILKSS